MTAEVHQYPKPSKRYKLVAYCFCYNQEKFIGDALEGFVSQQTTFPYVVLVVDDCSTDGTRNIIKAYAEKYPEIIVPIFLKENLFRHTNKKMEIIRPWLENCEYEAMCEGDDYWIYPQKLQQQVDFLDANPDYSICTHRVKVFDETKRKFIKDSITLEVPETTDLEYLAAHGNYIQTPTVVRRYNGKVYDKMARLGHTIMWDFIMHVLYAHYGKIKKLDGEWAVYRYGVGVWTNSGMNQADREVRTIRSIAKLTTLVDDDKIRDLLDSRIDVCEKEVREVAKRSYSVAYRIGRVLLKPVSLVLRLLGLRGKVNLY